MAGQFFGEPIFSGRGIVAPAEIFGEQFVVTVKDGSP